MLFARLSPLIAASLAVAVPTRRQAPSYPPTTTAQAFTLVANVTGNQAGVFSPPIGSSSWSLVGVHVGANLNVGVLDPGSGATLFVNGTGADVSRQSTSIGLPPSRYTTGNNTVVYEPAGMSFPGADGDGGGVGIQLNLGLPTTGAGIVGGLRSPWPQLFTPYGQGPYAVCNISDATYGNPQYRVTIPVEESVPDTCVTISLLAQCAALPELAGAAELGIVVEPVECYEDVSAIDWSLYSPYYA